MNIAESYDYLICARQDLWATLASLPDEVLSRPLLNGTEFHCIKDMLVHIPAVEDGWIHEDILRVSSLWETIPDLKNSAGGANYAGLSLQVLLDYWRSVEQSTLRYIGTLTEAELKRIVTLHDAPEKKFTVDGLLWHVMIHEMRHTAQVCVLLRLQNIKPPSLDLLFYLPSAATK